MTARELQECLVKAGHIVAVDGQFGPKSQAALVLALTDGSDTKLCNDDVQHAAELLRVSSAKVWTIWDVESTANPFIDGRPTILFEPHVFSRLTGHKYDGSHLDISSRKWNRKLYPGTQSGRYKQLVKAVSLDVDAGLSAASYGGFQILGSNHRVCGFETPWAFVHDQSRSERNQLLAFVSFVRGNKLDTALQRGDWAAFAKGYNGPAYRENQYDVKLAKAYAKRNK